MNTKKKGVSVVAGLVCAGLALTGGCAHPLTIKNLATYQSFGLTTFEKPVSIGIVMSTDQPEKQSLLNGVAMALGSYSARVIMPYSPGGTKPVDVIAHIEIDAVHDGSGWNFLINWPGFIVFAPAWNGYMYEVKYTVHCMLTKGSTNEVIDEFKLPIALDVRHADINRTWTEISWLEVSAIAFVGGLCFVSYDDSVTPLVSEKIEYPIGKYIASEIVKRINRHGSLTRSRPLESGAGLAMPRTPPASPQG